MKLASIPTEDNYVDWSLMGIRDYFRLLGYRIRTYSVGQVVERQCPVDRVLEVGNKVVGLQFKRPVRLGPPWKYGRTPHQHATILSAPWVFYCLPDFVDFGTQEVALFHCRFAPGRTLTAEGTIQGRYYRWGSFANAIRSCREGLLIKSSETALSVVDRMIERPTEALVTVNREAQEASVIAPSTIHDNET